MRRRWLVFLTGLVFVTNPGAVSACSCVPSTKQQLVDNASAIFTGTVTTVSRGFPFGLGCSVSSADPVSVTFAVETVYRGEAARSVTLQTAASGASCGYEFAAGRRYTVFAATQGGRLETNLCRGNLEGAIAPAEYGLGAGRPPG